jgi:hypothetical protein
MDGKEDFYCYNCFVKFILQDEKAQRKEIKKVNKARKHKPNLPDWEQELSRAKAKWDEFYGII